MLNNMFINVVNISIKYNDFQNRGKWSYYFDKILDKLLIKVGKSQQNLNILYLLYLRLRIYNFNLFIFYMYLVQRDNITKKFQFFQIKIAFFQFGI